MEWGSLWNQAKAAASTLAEEGAKIASEGAEIALQRAERAKELAASKAQALAEEIKEKGLEKVISDQAVSIRDSAEQKLRELSTNNEAELLGIPSDEELLEVGLTEEVFEFVCCLTPETFANFPDQISANDDHFMLTAFQEEHCRLVLRLSPEVVKLRYTLVPLHMTDGRFWSVYFTLVANQIEKQVASSEARSHASSTSRSAALGGSEVEAAELRSSELSESGGWEDIEHTGEWETSGWEGGSIDNLVALEATHTQRLDDSPQKASMQPLAFAQASLAGDESTLQELGPCGSPESTHPSSNLGEGSTGWEMTKMPSGSEMDDQDMQDGDSWGAGWGGEDWGTEMTLEVLDASARTETELEVERVDGGRAILTECNAEAPSMEQAAPLVEGEMSTVCSTAQLTGNTLASEAQPEPAALTEIKTQPEPKGPTDPRTLTEPEITTEPQPVPEPETPTELQPEPEPETPKEPQPVPDPETLTEPQSMPEPETTIEHEPEPEPETLAEPEPEPEPEITTELQPEPEPKTLAKVQSETETEAQLKSSSSNKKRKSKKKNKKTPDQPQPQPQLLLKADLLKADPAQKNLSEPHTKSIREPKHELKAESVPESEPVAEAAPEAETVHMAELMAEPEPKHVIKPEPKHVIKPEPEPVMEPEPVAEPDPEPMIKPDPETMAKPDPEPMAEPDPEPMAEPDPEPMAEPDPEPMAEPDPEPMAKPDPEPMAEPDLKPVAVAVADPEPEPLAVAEPEAYPELEEVKKDDDDDDSDEGGDDELEAYLKEALGDDVEDDGEELDDADMAGLESMLDEEGEDE